MSFKGRLLKNIFISGGYTYASQGVIFISSMVTSRLLSPETFGFVGLITIFIGFITIFSDSGISLAIIKSDYLKTYHQAVDNLALLVGIILCFATCLLAYPISAFYNNTRIFFPLIVMSSIFIIRSMSLVRGALLSKQLNFKIIGKTNLISTVISVIITIIMALLDAGYWSLIIPQIIANLVILVIYQRIIKLKLKIYPYRYIVVAYRYTKRTIGGLMGFNIVNYWARNSDNLIVGRVYGINDLGIYNRAYTLLTLPLSLVTGLIGAVLYPSLKKLKTEGGSVNKEYFFVLKMITFISYPITFLLIMFPHQIVLFLWGNNWIEVGKLIPYFGLLIFSQSLLSTAGQMLVLMEKEKELLISGWIGAIAMVAAICYGSLFSITKIAQYYSLAFIIFVLPFNVVYIYIRTLKFPITQILIFWLPIILFSFGIWISCFYDSNISKLTFLSLILIFILSTSMNEIKKGKHKLSLILKRS